MKSFFAAALLISAVFGAELMIQMEPDVQAGQPASWARVARASETEAVNLIFVLKHDKDARDQLESIFWAVSDPRDTAYGEHLTIDEITDIVEPSKTNQETVIQFLTANGVDRDAVSVSRNGDMISADVPVEAAEKMLATEFYVWQHKVMATKFLIRAGSEYHLPASVSSVVSFVGNVLYFPHMAKPSSGKPVTVESDDEFNSCGSTCAGYVTPAVLKKAYSLTNAPNTATTGNKVAVAEFQGEYWDNSDLTSFSSNCGIDTVAVHQTYGGNDPSSCTDYMSDCTESLLDIEFMGAIASPIPMDVFYSDNYDLLTWIQTVAATDDAALVHSVSYGNDEAQQSGAAFMESVNTELMKIGARGISILFASGDQGVWGREGTSTGVFNPDFPGGSPYLTAVGGTNFVTAGAIGEEEAWNASGGGFSNTFARPSYQEDAVTGYFTAAASSLPASNLYNSTGRGYPDVAALGGGTNPYCVYAVGAAEGVYGTSASSPVVAGVFGKLNEVRLAAGGKPLGFLNPFIYQNPSGFNDVTKGLNNAGSGAGFSAAAGWDPTTGMGSPNFEALSKLV